MTERCGLHSSSAGFFDLYDQCFNREIISLPRIWMSFFATEEAHAVMPATVTDEGGRAAPQGMSTAQPMEVCGGERPPPGSAGPSRLTATAQFGAKKDIPIPRHYNVKENKCSSLFYGG
jgi:hypothetical protein